MENKILQPNSPISSSLENNPETYNSTNLPLSSLKTIKKALPGVTTIIIFWIGYLYLRKLFIATINNPVPITDPSESSINYWLNLIDWIVNLGAVFLILGISLFEYLYYKFYYYSFKELNAVIRKGVVSSSTGHVRYERLQNIYVDQDILDRIFGLYDVHYETAGEVSGFYSHVDGLNKENSDKLVDFLNDRVNDSDNDRQKQSIAQEISSAPESGNNNETMPEAEITRENCPISPVIVFVRFVNSFFSILILVYWMYAILLADLPIIKNISYPILVNVFVILIIFGSSLIFNLIWYKNFYFNFGKDKAQIRSKVISQSFSFLYYNRIQNINIKQGITDRLFGIYSLSIETAGEKSSTALKIPGLTLENADKLRDYLIVKSQRNQKNL